MGDATDPTEDADAAISVIFDKLMRVTPLPVDPQVDTTWVSRAEDPVELESMY